MFRNLFRSLTATRPQARTQVRSFQPRLEVLENRLAPSNFGLQLAQGSHNHIFQDGNHNVAVQAFQGSHNDIVQVGHHDVAIQAFQGSHNTIVQVP